MTKTLVPFATRSLVVLWSEIVNNRYTYLLEKKVNRFQFFQWKYYHADESPNKPSCFVIITVATNEFRRFRQLN